MDKKDKQLSNFNKFIIFISLIIFIWLIFDLFVFGARSLEKEIKMEEVQESKNNSQENNEEISVEAASTDIFYWGDGCPHCETVKAWMAENKIEEKIEIVSKEVYKNQANSAELAVRAKSCGMDTQRIGVPFLYTLDGQCLVGSPNIIEYLLEKIIQ
jgi:glutaredoxin